MPRFCLAAISTSLAAIFAVSLAHAQSSEGGEVENRLLRLEEQIVDLSAQVGTLETIAKNGTSGSAAAASPSFSGDSSGFSGSSDDRIILMETQLRALSSQLSELVDRMNRLEVSGGASAGSYREGAVDDQPPNLEHFGLVIEDEASGGQESYLEDSQDGESSLAPNSAAVQIAAQSSPEAQVLYDDAYNALVQRNYRGAAGSFRQFVDQYPSDPLAGQAYYWLGEAAFVNGQYSDAADSFLKSSTNYPNNQKAPESLLKLGISLKRLGETQAACSSFSELGRRFPDSTQILERADRERQRTQC
ncbi:MAG: tol-pal system protein YbgF [Hyphomicrobiales bacterium]|nr:tol-pal system protein YbgF [Hyphomicrobiales bacterium]